MRIDIDLRATRGEAGFQAIIDIVPDTKKAPAKPKAVEELKDAKEPKADGKKDPESDPPVPAAQAGNKTLSIASGKLSGAKGDTVILDELPEAKTGDQDPVEGMKPVLAAVPSSAPAANEDKPEAPAQSKEPPKSIFSNLKKPVNG